MSRDRTSGDVFAATQTTARRADRPQSATSSGALVATEASVARARATRGPAPAAPAADPGKPPPRGASLSGTPFAVSVVFAFSASVSFFLLLLLSFCCV